MSAKTIVVTRKPNDTEVQWTFEVKPLKAKKGEAPRFAYVPKKPTTPDEETQYMAFIGQKDAAAMVGRLHRQWSVNWSESASTKTNGQPMDSDIYQKTFSQLASEMSAEGLSLKALTQEESELKSELFSILSDKSLTSAQKEEKMLVVATRMKEIEDTIAARKAANKTDDEEAEVDSNATEASEGETSNATVAKAA